MRKEDAAAEMTKAQAEIADQGVKAMIPIDRPFLDYVLHNLARAGYKKICLVIGPEHNSVREYYNDTIKCSRISIDFAVQEKPLGTADAVAAVRQFAGNDNFLVINSDNFYPIEALQGLRKLNGPGLAGFERESMIAGGNIPAERITKFAVIKTDGRGCMSQIIEKPDAQTISQLPEPVCLSMNCWRLSPEIFTACDAISPSARGELELPDAVQYTIGNMNQRYRSLTVRAPVLDMSCRSDVDAIVKILKGSKVDL